MLSRYNAGTIGNLRRAHRVGKNLWNVARNLPLRELGVRPRWERKLGFGFKRPATTRFAGPPAKKVKLNDPSRSYVQLTMTKRKYGRKVSQRARQAKLVKSVTEPIRFRFGSVTDINDTEGVYWLNQQLVSGTIGTNATLRMPVYIFNLFTLSQGGNPVTPESVVPTFSPDPNFYAKPFFELYRTEGGGYTWGYVTGKNPSDGTTDTFIKRRISPTIADAHEIGRKGLLDWTRIKMCIWGKKTNPSMVRVRLVKFTDEDFCPEKYLNRGTGFSSNPPSKVNEFWEEHCNYLVNGPQGGQPRTDRKKYMKVLKDFIININPIDAAAEAVGGDDRAHMKHLEIFNRWNRVLDYTEPAGSAAALDPIADLRNVNVRNGPGESYSGYLRSPEQAVYVLIESVQPLTSEGTASTAIPRPDPLAQNKLLTVSFDLSVESNYTVMEKF